MRFSSTAAYWPASPIDARTRIGSLVTSTPSTRARPPSGGSSVVSTRTAVVLPAPFGPSRPSTRPAGRERDALERFDVAEALDQALDDDCRFHAASLAQMRGAARHPGAYFCTYSLTA